MIETPQRAFDRHLLNIDPDYWQHVADPPSEQRRRNAGKTIMARRVRDHDRDQVRARPDCSPLVEWRVSDHLSWRRGGCYRGRRQCPLRRKAAVTADIILRLFDPNRNSIVALSCKHRSHTVCPRRRDLFDQLIGHPAGTILVRPGRCKKIGVENG